MTITSLFYLLFLLVTIVLFYVVPKRYQWIVLLFASLTFFCLVGTWWTLIYLVAATAATWFAGNRILLANSSDGVSTTEDNNVKKGSKKSAKTWFIIALIVDLGLLAALKYTNFILKNAGYVYSLISGNAATWQVSWVAALGVSFYTLQIVGYLLDCYWGIAKPEKNFFKFSAFTCFFPQMVSGPINRYNDLSAEIFREHKYNWSNIREGVIRIAVGFFKKMVLADNIAKLSSSFLDQNEGILAFIGMVAYVIQIYADFAGCMDIVIGSAKCLDIKVVENFKSPFRSLTIQEFWRRWHITLGTWLKDYVMYPLLRTKLWIKMTKSIKTKWGKRCAKLIPTHIAMLILWFCMGLWHGGGWNFILEGIWFWIVIVLGEWLSPLFKKITKNFKEENFLWVWFRRLRTMLIYAIGALMFRASGVVDAFQLLKRVFSPRAMIGSLSSFVSNFRLFLDENMDPVVIAILGFILFLVIARIEYGSGGVAKKLEGKPLFFQILIPFLLVFVTIVFGVYGNGYNAADFIYGGF